MYIVGPVKCYKVTSGKEDQPKQNKKFPKNFAGLTTPAVTRAGPINLSA